MLAQPQVANVLRVLRDSAIHNSGQQCHVPLQLVDPVKQFCQ